MIRNRFSSLLLFGTTIVLLIVINRFITTPQSALSFQSGTPPNSETTVAFAKSGCAGCHTIPGVPNAVGQVGPDLSAIGAVAGERKAGFDAEAYIRESIIDPAALIAPSCPNGDCPENVMLPNFAERLTGAEIDNIVAYLLSLNGDGVASEVTEVVAITI